MRRDYEKEINLLGRDIVHHISTQLLKSKSETNTSEIPYLDQNKCKSFSISWYFAKYGLFSGRMPNCPIRSHSHVTITWIAKPCDNSSIIWTSSKTLKSEYLIAIIDSLIRDKRLESVLK